MSGETTEKCRVFLEPKPVSEMKKRADRPNGVDTLCKPCRREKEYFRVHGVERPKDLLVVFKLIAGVKHKRCPMCSEYKTYDNFHKCSANQEGVWAYCFPCKAVVRKQERLKNGEHIRQLSRAWIKNNYEKNKLEDTLRGEKYRTTNKFKINRKRYLDNPDVVKHRKQQNRISSKLAVATINERYVRSNLGARSPIKGSEFPQELVKAHQELMKLRRFIKENRA